MFFTANPQGLRGLLLRGLLLRGLCQGTRSIELRAAHFEGSQQLLSAGLVIGVMTSWDYPSPPMPPTKRTPWKWQTLGHPKKPVKLEGSDKVSPQTPLNAPLNFLSVRNLENQTCRGRALAL